MMDISGDLLQWSINILIKKTSASLSWSENLITWNKFAGSGIINENISTKELPEELHKPIIRKLKKEKVHSPFIDNV